MRSMGALLKVESAVVFVTLVGAYFWLGFNGWLFAALFFAPDLAFATYLAGPKIGAWVYNLMHFYGLAAVLAGLGLVMGSTLLMALGLIFAAHIAFDRMLGYGLKHESDFKDTHLGRIGSS